MMSNIVYNRGIFGVFLLLVFNTLFITGAASDLNNSTGAISDSLNNSLNNSCIDCHKNLSPFTDEQKRFNDIRQNHIDRNISCSLECHEDVIRKTANDNYQQWTESDHSKYYVTCNACHGGNPNAKTKTEAHTSIKNSTDPNSTIYYKNVPVTCGKCHTEELTNFKNTMHYQRLSAEARAPSCITCHRPHTFKVLKASEITPVCSLCHNPTDNIAPANVPKDAQSALEKADELQAEILKAKNIISDAKTKGEDISSAQADIDRAIAIQNNIPSLWHEFNLANFDQQIQTGIDSVKNAEEKVSGVEPKVNAVPGFGIYMAIGVFAIIYLIRRRNM